MAAPDPDEPGSTGIAKPAPVAADASSPATAAASSSSPIAGTPGQPVLRRVATLLAPYKGQLLLVAVAVVISAGLTSVAPFLTRAVFDDALFPVGPTGAVAPPDLRLLAWLIGGLVAIPLVSALIGVGQTWLTTRIGNGAMADLRVALFEHLERMELAFFTSTRTGDIQSRLANDVSGVRSVLTSTATTILQNVVTVIAAFVSMVLLSWQLTIITLVLMPLFMVIQVRVGKRRKALQRRTQESLSEMTAITEESLGVSGVLLAKVFNRADVEVARYRRENRRQTRLQVRNAMTGQTFFSIVSTFFGLTPAIVYLVAGLLINGGTLVGGATLTAGTIIAFTTLQSRLQQPLVQLMRVTLDVQTSFALFARLFEYLDLEPAITDRPGARVLRKSDVRGDVELRDVWFRYPSTRAESAPGGAASSSSDGGGRRGAGGRGGAGGGTGGGAGGRRGPRGRSGRGYRALEVPMVAALTDMAGANVLPPTSAPGLAAAVSLRVSEPLVVPAETTRGATHPLVEPVETTRGATHPLVEPVETTRRATHSPIEPAETAPPSPTPLPEARKYLDIDVTDLAQVGEDLDADGRISDDEKWALADLSLTVRAGQLAALVGPSGSGKTTLTYLVPRLHEVTRGAVLVDGVDVRDVTLGSLADVVGMVTQEPYLFHGTITENLRYARADATDAEIVEACRAANIHDRIMSFADGYETITGERGFRLSGGEKQRLSIARVLIKDPRILILDEATSALDTATERLVQQALERAMADRTTFAIAHRLSTIMNADVIFGIADGRLVEQGTHAELLERGGLYARLYQEQFGAGAVEARLADAVQFADGATLPRAATHPKPDVAI
ncbi:ABC transporter ATP-binding protein [Xylanimonas ulmi]|uniref:ATP-binding cassette subfamily B protein n=1 Tax=Xylanimonas ulmi TaxID=228973 RepID=A0A4Q7M819_9MICO|nr:ABC transporter ATP-binding protein [Xylanibacterium ulmi]RZS62838.1 ATP-binding cassette subfamily B protein [Xylanibacterium ulmi]